VSERFARPRARFARRAIEGGLGLGKVLLFVAGLLAAVGGGYFAATNLAGDASAAPAASAEQDRSEEHVFMEFGSILVNLAEPRLTRYLKVTLTLEADPPTRDLFTRLAADKRDAVFKDWLITHLSDKQLDDVKGAGAINRLRRELTDGLNTLLAEYGEYRVANVFFTELNVQ